MNIYKENTSLSECQMFFFLLCIRQNKRGTETVDISLRQAMMRNQHNEKHPIIIINLEYIYLIE
jgi:hypothetical protein